MIQAIIAIAVLAGLLWLAYKQLDTQDEWR